MATMHSLDVAERLQLRERSLRRPKHDVVVEGQVDGEPAISMTRHAGSNRSTIPSGRKCYLCARNELSPM